MRILPYRARSKSHDFLKKEKRTFAKNGEMAVIKQPKIPLSEVHFHGFTVRTAPIPLL